MNKEQILEKFAEKKIYVSGPITGIPEDNYPNFVAAAQSLYELGYRKIVVPHDLFRDHDPKALQWSDYMRGCIKEMMDCEALITIPGWEESNGAKLEVYICNALNIPVFALHHLAPKSNDELLSEKQ